MFLVEDVISSESRLRARAKLVAFVSAACVLRTTAEADVLVFFPAPMLVDRVYRRRSITTNVYGEREKDL